MWMIAREESSNYLAHHGIKGQKWGIRRYQNPDGSYTEEGRARYGNLAKKYKHQYNKFNRMSKKYGAGPASFKYRKGYIDDEDLKPLTSIPDTRKDWNESRKKIINKANNIIDNKKNEWKKIGEDLYKVAPKESGWYSLMEERVLSDIWSDDSFKRLVEKESIEYIKSDDEFKKRVDEIASSMGRELDPKNNEKGKTFVLLSLANKEGFGGAYDMALGRDNIYSHQRADNLKKDVYELLDYNTDYRDWLRSEEERLESLRYSKKK